MYIKENIKKTFPAMLLIASIFCLSTIIALVLGIPFQQISRNYSYSVIIILIIMELFTNLIIETGVMQYLATKMAILSKGNKNICMILLGLLMFFVSAFLNNITAVLITLPVLLALIKSLDIDKKYMATFFGVMLALSNTGGAASPIGDFPALVIMASGITTFSGYLFRAFPVFLITSVVLLFVWGFNNKDTASKNSKLLTIDLLHSRYKNRKVRKDVLFPLIVILILMFIAWGTIPQTVLPPEIIALLGYCLSIIVVSAKGLQIKQKIEMKPILLIGAFLFMATVISESGILSELVSIIVAHNTNPKILLVIIMIVTSIIAGVFSAGPASAAMMPIIVNMCNTDLAMYSDWVAIAYAAAICAGSSLFLWSATAGFVLSEKINVAELECDGKKLVWGIKEYLYYGFINYVVQMYIAIAIVLIVI